MLKSRALSIGVAVFLTLCFVGSALAMEKGNKRKGKLHLSQGLQSLPCPG
jgi:hypothetical protein